MSVGGIGARERGKEQWQAEDKICALVAGAGGEEERDATAGKESNSDFDPNTPPNA